MRSSGTVRIGKNVRIRSAAQENPISCGDRTYFQVLQGAILTIGDGCGISNSAITCQSKVTLEDYVMLGAGVKIFDADFHPVEFDVRINGGLGRSKEILIWRGVFIGAGSVVTKDVPPRQIWAGNPAKFIKELPAD